MTAPVSVKTLSESLDIASIEQDARSTWDKDQRRRRRIESTIIKALPLGLVVMSVAFYLLSAPHTAYLINLITPGWGFVAPIAFELGVLIIAGLREAGWRNALTLLIELALILMSMMVNVIGGFIAVVAFGTNSINSSIDIQALTINQLANQFGNIPAVYQAALMLVIPVGMVIPFIAALVGEILVKLSLNRIRLEQETDEQRWRKEAARVMYTALLQTALKAGAGAKTAGNFAQSVVDEMYRYRPLPNDARPARGDGIMADGRDLSVRPQLSATGQSIASLESHRAPMGFIPPASATGQADGRTDSGQEADKAHGNGIGYASKRDASTVVREHLAAHPEDMAMTVRELAAKIGVGKTTVSDTMRDLRAGME